MDFLDPKNRKAHRIRLFIGYGLMAVALAIATVLIAMLTSGYDVDRKTGEVIQNGLVMVGSQPVEADVSVNGVPKGRTDQRLILPEGSYSIELKRDGYRSWQHKVTLEGSSIEQLVYPFLFPVKLESKPVTTLAARPGMVSQSPDRRWLVMQDMSKLGQFDLYDLNDKDTPLTKLSLPADTFNTAAGEHTFKEVEWASDNTNLLLEHRWPTGLEYILLNRSNALQSINASKLFPDFGVFQLSLRDKKPNQFYLYNPTTRSLLSGTSGTPQPTPLLAHAVQFKSYKDDTIIYVNDSKEVHLLQKGKDYLIRSLPESSLYLLEYAEFNNKAYLVAGSASDGKTYVYVDPLASLTRVPARAPQPLRVLIVEKPEYVSFSAIARFIAVQSGSKFAVFDAETGRQFRYDLKLELAPNHEAGWMDGHRLSLVSNGKNIVFDFDGQNLQFLSSGLPGGQLYFNRDYEAMFSLAANQDKTELQRTELIVK